MRSRSFSRRPTRSPVNLIGAVLATTLAIVVAGCESSATTSTGPSPVKCQVALAAVSNSVGASGGTGTISVTTQPECAWTASTDASWISGLAPASGQGNGQVQFQVPANPAPAMRQGDIVVNGDRVQIRQEPATCRFDVAPMDHAVAAGGGAASVSVTTAAGCSWTAAADPSWISVTSGATGSGGGTVSFTVAPNTGGVRSGSLSVAGQTVTVEQAAVTSTCSYTVTPLALAIATAGGAAPPVSVSTTAGCAWTATSDVPWITVTAGTNGSGNGTVSLTVASNAGAERTGTVMIAGQTLRVTQAGVAGSSLCVYAISPSTESLPAGGGAGSPITISTFAGCTWTASTDATWITITSAASGVANGTVTYSVAANSGGGRTGTITIAGLSFTVTQAAPPPSTCVYTISPVTLTVPPEAGSGPTIAVSAPTGCAWTATSNAAWISITSGSSGSGAGSVGFRVEPNAGGARTDTLTIAGQTFMLTQTGTTVLPPAPPPPPPPPACVYSIAPTSQSIGAAGGPGTDIALSTSSGCTWTATSSVPWITLTSGTSGSGNGTVEFNVAANTGAARTGTITIASQTFTVSQAAAPPPPPCSYTIAPATQSVATTAGAGTPVAVSTTAACTWTATTTTPWIAITSGASGTGNGSVAFNVAANTGAARSGTMTIAGQTATVNQAAAAPSCTYAIAPTSQSLTAAGGTGSPVSVSTAAGCTWTATSGVSWITVTSGATGSGNGSVGFTVASHSGSARTGTLTIAGRTFTVTQAAPCTYSISPSNDTVDDNAGSGEPVSVTAPAGCAWTASTSTSWITITSGASGSGNGTVEWRVSANPGARREGTITIAGRTFTVTQRSKD